MQTLLILATNGGTDTGSGNAGGAIAGLLPFLLIGVVFYFLIIRPQRSRQRHQRQMIADIGIGDQVVTIGGFHGTIVDVSDDILRVELAPNIVVTMAKQAVSRRVNPEPVLDDFGGDGDEYDLDEVDVDADRDDRDDE